MKLLHALLIATVSCGLASSSALAGAGSVSGAKAFSSANTRLVIRRAPNFGNQSNISVYIDGRLATILRYGGGYDAFISPGRHLVTMKQTPHLNDAYPYSQRWIRVAPGETSVFTAIWRDGGTRIALEES